MVSCGAVRGGGSHAGGEVTGVGANSYSEPVPYGMVLVDVGSMREGPSQRDSVWGIDSTAHGISVDAFWMDETEITNSKYKQFVYWVRDSIIRERLADPAYGGNEEFKIEEDKEGNPVTPHLNWSKSIPWKNPSEDTATKSTTSPKPQNASTASMPLGVIITPTTRSTTPCPPSARTPLLSTTTAASSARRSRARCRASSTS